METSDDETPSVRPSSKSERIWAIVLAVLITVGTPFICQEYEYDTLGWTPAVLYMCGVLAIYHNLMVTLWSHRPWVMRIAKYIDKLLLFISITTVGYIVVTSIVFVIALIYINVTGG